MAMIIRKRARNPLACSPIVATLNMDGVARVFDGKAITNREPACASFTIGDYSVHIPITELMRAVSDIYSSGNVEFGMPSINEEFNKRMARAREEIERGAYADAPKGSFKV